MNGIDITDELVQEIADRIEQVTGGRFRAPYVSRPGDGENFVDTNRAVSWRGPEKAAAYYLAILRQVAPDVAAGAFAPVASQIDRAEGVEEAAERGRGDAVYYL